MPDLLVADVVSFLRFQFHALSLRVGETVRQSELLREAAARRRTSIRTSRAEPSRAELK
jgi:hypothetical protein